MQQIRKSRQSLIWQNWIGTKEKKANEIGTRTFHVHHETPKLSLGLQTTIHLYLWKYLFLHSFRSISNIYWQFHFYIKYFSRLDRLTLKMILHLYWIKSRRFPDQLPKIPFPQYFIIPDNRAKLNGNEIMKFFNHCLFLSIHIFLYTLNNKKKVIITEY